jgi:lysophospholipid acyltransferase (LPLAT)-like uncharacterized protein
MKDKLEHISAKLMARYISWVYKTSHVEINDPNHILDSTDKNILVFWHGDSYCMYPSLKGYNVKIATTVDRRGDYIEDMCRYFGYSVFRVPDISNGGLHLLKLTRLLRDSDEHMAIAIDGPLGPLHHINDFSLLISYMSKRDIVPVKLKIKRYFTLNHRWDKFKIPLPFNRIELEIGFKIEVTAADRQNGFEKVKRIILETI